MDTGRGYGAVLGCTLGVDIAELLGIRVQLHFSRMDALAHSVRPRAAVCRGRAGDMVVLVALAGSSGVELLFARWFMGDDNARVGSASRDSDQAADATGRISGSGGSDRGVRVHVLLVHNSECSVNFAAGLAAAEREEANFWICR